MTGKCQLQRPGLHRSCSRPRFFHLRQHPQQCLDIYVRTRDPQHNAVGPPEPSLNGVFASTAGRVDIKIGELPEYLKKEAYS